jgi:predicted nucleotidyltransferase
MSITLAETLQILRQNEAMLRARGIMHAAVFGSVARGEASHGSDVDILVDLEPDRPCGVYEFVRLQLDIGELIGAKADLAERTALKPLVRDAAIKDAVHVF